MTPDEGKVVNELLQSLQDELSGEQRDSVEELIRRHGAIFWKHEYGIGRTSLVEYRIDTGDHRPIRQPLRRHPLQHLEAIDRKVEEMHRHNIIEPAASPWASNVVLVEKKDGSLGFCDVQVNKGVATWNRPQEFVDICGDMTIVILKNIII